MSTEVSSPRSKWKTIHPGVQQKCIRPGPWFQFHDSVGFEWNTYDVSLPNLPAALDGFRLIQLSDMHCQPHWQTAYDELIDRIRADEPDLIVFTGDLIDYITKPWQCLPTARKLLPLLRARHGLLGVFGNHDKFTNPANYNGTPLRMIDGQRLLIDHDGSPFELIGVPGPERIDCPANFGKSMPAKTPGIPRIMLAHFPDHIRRLKVLQPDIYLSGHTHGGQACLPGGIPIQRHDSLPINYFKGAHQLYGTHFFVSRGFGFSTFNFRAFCPSEVIEIRLKSHRTLSSNL